MPRTLLAALAVALTLAGCSRRAPDPRAADVAEAERPTAPAQTAPPAAPAPADEAKVVEALVAKFAAPAAESRHDAALREGLALLAERKYARALAALEDARAARDTEQVRQEIAKVRDLIGRQAAAERTVEDIRAALAAGKAEEAGRLAAAALAQYGGSDAADELARLKRQADALAAEALRTADERRDRFAREAAAALQDNNLRAAALALEQALQGDEAPQLRRQYDDVRGRLARYDDGRRKAAELRRDPSALEDALAALRDAAAAWDTPQVRQEIDECTLALQRRRDRLAVADFEVRGDVGLPGAGKSVADELLPAFKSRFDLVERGQLSRVLAELSLDAAELSASDHGRREVGRLAKVRYLVLGSLSPLGGVTAQARLVDVQTGLVVQTAKLTAPTVETLLPRLPQLAQVLLMTDEQKLAFEQALAQRAPEVRPVEATAPLPPPPPPVVVGPPPPPIVVYTPRPADPGGLVVADLYRLPAAPPPAVAVDVALARNDPYNRKLLAVSLELGDNLLRRGNFKDALRHFELALTLTDDRKDIEVRIGRARPQVPVVVPPPVVVAPVVVARPRVAVFNFLVHCPPGLVPPAFGDWAADHFVSYCGGVYEVVERGELCWYMGRLNLTMRDVLYNPAARRCLARALDVRYFLFGAIEHTASFDVTAHLVDADTGAKAGAGRIHVQDQAELKLRVQELVRQVGAGADERQRLAHAGAASERALAESRKLLAAGDAARAAAAARAALRETPHSVALEAVAREAEERQRQQELEMARRREAERARAEAEAARKRQEELARQAEALRQKAQAEAKARDEAARRAAEEQKQRAADRLHAEARQAAQKGDFEQAVRALQSAAALRPSDELARELAQVKAQADEAARRKAAEEAARREAERQRQAEAAAAQLAAARRKAGDEAARRKAQAVARRPEPSAPAPKPDAKPAPPPPAPKVEPKPATAPAPTADPKAPAPLSPAARAELDRQLTAAAFLERKGKLAEAVAAYRRAAQLAPGEPKVRQALTRAELSLHLGAGRQALAARRFAEAVQAFEAALRVAPDNAEARAGLQKAREGK